MILLADEELKTLETILSLSKDYNKQLIYLLSLAMLDSHIKKYQL